MNHMLWRWVAALVGAAQQCVRAGRFPRTIVVLDGMMWSIVWKIACTAAEEGGGRIVMTHAPTKDWKWDSALLTMCRMVFTAVCTLRERRARVRETYLTDIWIRRLKMPRMTFHAAPPKLRTSAGFLWNKSPPALTLLVNTDRADFSSTKLCLFVLMLIRMTSPTLDVLHCTMLNSDYLFMRNTKNPIAIHQSPSYKSLNDFNFVRLPKAYQSLCF